MSATINQRLSHSQAANLTRLIIGVIMALAVTLSLFWLMQYLIETADRTLNEDGSENATAKMMLSILATLFEFEREMILERQREGIAKAKERGVEIKICEPTNNFATCIDIR